MIVVPFSIHDLCYGEERFLSPHFVRERIEHFKCLFRECLGEVIALHMQRSSELVCAVAALVELHTPFTIINSRDGPLLYGAQWLYDEKQLYKISSLENKTSESDDGRCEDLCFTIRTSGTTGEAKLVAVPFSCIEPNVDDFRERFHITSQDVILCATSFCFDPSIIELFLPFTTGADLLLVPDHVRSQPHLFSSVLRRYKPTIVQLTPSVLSLLDENTLAWIFGSSSPIRCLLLGGEKFPSKLVKRFRSPSNLTKVFNVYGVTEVSCWASIAEIPHSFNNVTIGSPLKSTTFTLTEENELLLGGSRRCCVNGMWNVGFTATGDIVQMVNGGLDIVGRTDEQVKLNGVRCNLSAISESVQSLSHVTFARASIYKEKFLVLFVKADVPIEDALRVLIPAGLFPSKIVYLDIVPVNRNGKVDCSKLLEILEEQCSKAMKTSTSLLAFLSKFGIKVDSDLSNHSFTDYGTLMRCMTS
ncbi:unnamed protein product [Cylicocyclus nassatus]|uniref:AMP-dependent synthetase/ligase domain-containing protein n=1 Tax=Cylicocyclus nassatus TaxID=53992 RepID=A0AA36MF36_CYLNA|nr:unnamed protein product [Cylicocyclus nassatus]